MDENEDEDSEPEVMSRKEFEFRSKRIGVMWGPELTEFFQDLLFLLWLFY